MCKKKSQIKKEASTGCIRETPHRKTKYKPAGDMSEKLPDKQEANTGCVRETPHIKTKSAWDV